MADVFLNSNITSFVWFNDTVSFDNDTYGYDDSNIGFDTQGTISQFRVIVGLNTNVTTISDVVANAYIGKILKSNILTVSSFTSNLETFRELYTVTSSTSDVITPEYMRIIRTVIVDSISQSSVTLIATTFRRLDSLISSILNITSNLTLGVDEFLNTDISGVTAVSSTLKLGVVEPLNTSITVTTDIVETINCKLTRKIDSDVQVDNGSQSFVRRLREVPVNIDSSSSSLSHGTVNYKMYTSTSSTTTVKKAFIYTKVFEEAQFVPLYNYVIPGLPNETFKFNHEFYNVYSLLSTVANGGVRYNTYAFRYNAVEDSLDLYYKDNVIMRITKEGNIILKGIVMENSL